MACKGCWRLVGSNEWDIQCQWLSVLQSMSYTGSDGCLLICRVLLEKKQRRGKSAQEVLAALSFLEVEERVGRASLDAAEFRYVLHRFCELARLDPDEVGAPGFSLKHRDVIKPAL